MQTTAVIGATGTLGRRAAAAAAARGHQLILIGRDAATLREVATPLGDRVTSVRTVPSEADEAALVAALDGVDVAVSVLPVVEGVAARTLAAAVEGAVHLVDSVDHQGHLLQAYDRFGDRARGTGTVVVPGVGWRTAIGDLLAAIAASKLGDVREVHVTAVVPDRGGVLGAASPGVRRAIAAALGEPSVAFEHGERVEELPGQARRLAWFPRPVGPHHAASVPGLEPLTVPAHVPGVETVRTYIAISSLRAELLQATASLTRRPGPRRLLARRLERAAQRSAGAGARWAVVAEAAGADEQLVRAWANGSDHLDVSARLLVAVAEAIGAGDALPGVRPPALVGAPRELLDHLTADSEVRWSVADPRGQHQSGPNGSPPA